jgi:hypothetical protein
VSRLRDFLIEIEAPQHAKQQVDARSSLSPSSAMDILQQASELLRPLMDAGRRDTWLSLAFHDQHRDIYDSIDQSGATREFTLRLRP